jgi:Tol biopolymer transport system component
MIDEREVRDMLRRRADGISALPTDAPGALKRAYRRMVRTGVGALTALALVVATVVGLGALHPRTIQPTIKPGPNEVGFQQMRGRIVYTSGQSLFAVDAAKPTGWKVVGLANGWPDAWSADGSRLLILSLNWQTGSGPSYYILNRDGTQVPLSTDPPANWGSLSPDGSRVVYMTDPYWKGRQGIYLINTNGGASQLLVRSSGVTPNTPAWSPDGSKIAFLNSKRPKAQSPANPQLLSNISLINPNGTGRRVLVDLSPYVGGAYYGNESSLAWSPDGSMLTFSMGSSTKDSQIWVVGADGAGLRQITHGGFDWSPAWSPDGSRIAFERNVRQHFVFTVAPDGSDLRMIDTVRPTGPITWNPVP